VDKEGLLWRFVFVREVGSVELLVCAPGKS